MADFAELKRRSTGRPTILNPAQANVDNVRLLLHMSDFDINSAPHRCSTHGSYDTRTISTPIVTRVD